MKVLIIEDELKSRQSLENIIIEYCTDVQIIGSVGSISEARKIIDRLPIDLIFLDIELPLESGFKLFDYYPRAEFDVIFTTAYGEYALQALKLSAVDYLLKPIDVDELIQAIEKVKIKKSTDQKQYDILKTNLIENNKRIILPSSEGFEYAEVNEIIRCEAQGNYTKFYMNDGEKIMVSKTLKIFEKLLQGLGFFRINRSNLINLKYVKKYGRQKVPTITLKNGDIINVSINRKDGFIEMMQKL